MGISEILVILVLFLLLFGPDKLPSVARALGKVVREFRKATDQIKNEINDKTKLD